MTEIMVFVITVLAVVIIALLFYIIKNVKSDRDSQKTAELEKQIAALSMYLQRTTGSNAEEFERNRRELNESLHLMTGKLDEMTRQNYETLIKL
ncbi:MAG: hypothetical protein IK955_08070, partial [Clostridia bacterium]|nr:hypothetical protein [Clostridia bacterium]